MNRPQIVVGVVGVIVASVLGAPAVGQAGTPTVVLTQGDDSVRVTPLGDGSRSVEAFYDYRSPATEPTGQYSSYGTRDIQMDQVSQLFVYHGSDGLSLVFLHDEFSDTADGGAVITADISGLPESGDWVVEDDTYDERDDVFRHGSGSSHIEWLSNGYRTDGAAFRGLEEANDTAITVDMQFNEESGNYPFEEWEGSPEQNEIERWIVRSGTGETTELAMDEPVEVSVESDRHEPTTEPTDDATPPADTPATPNTTTPDETEGSDAAGPGFGVAPAIIALVVLATLVLGRHD